MSILTLDVPDISCDHCRTSIEGALAPLPGVQRALVDVTARTVTVAFDDGALDTADLRRVIEDAGYEVAG